MKFFVTTTKTEAVALLTRLDLAFGYPDGNAQRYGDLVMPFNKTELRMAVLIEDRCLSHLSTAEKSKLMDVLPTSFNPPMPIPTGG